MTAAGVHGRIDRSEKEAEILERGHYVHGRIDRSERMNWTQTAIQFVHGRIDRSETRRAAVALDFINHCLRHHNAQRRASARA